MFEIIGDYMLVLLFFIAIFFVDDKKGERNMNL